MGIAIAGGAGLLLGLGLLWWGLRERSARHKAERAADDAELGRKEAVGVANHNAAQVAEMEKQAVRLSEQAAVLRARLTEVRMLVVQRATVATIKALIDTEAHEETI